MKKLLFALLILLSAHRGFAQVSADSTNGIDLYSDTEKFADSAGSLIQKDYIRLGNILDCTIQLVHYTDLLKGGKVSALRFVNTTGQQVYLDPNEISILAASMKIIKEKILGTAPSNYNETFYRNPSGFEAGCSFSKGKWTGYLQLRRHDNSSVTVMKKGDFDIFLKILDNAKAQL